jgi:hypothetical protein
VRRSTRGRVGFRYQLATPDGELLDEAVDLDVEPKAGDVIEVAGLGKARVVSVVPIRGTDAVADETMHGVLEVEPV